MAIGLHNNRGQAYCKTQKFSFQVLRCLWNFTVNISLKLLSWLAVAAVRIHNNLSHIRLVLTSAVVVFDFTRILTDHYIARSMAFNVIDTIAFNTLPFDNLNCSIMIKLLILLAGDVEKNPGPDSITLTNCFSVLHQNIRSIRNKFEYIQNFLLDFDILCFTETHLANDFSDENLMLDHFDCMFRKDKNQHSGGFLVYTHSRFRPVRLTDFETLLPESLCIEINDHRTRYAVCTVYRPPDSRIEFWDRLNIFIENICDSFSNIILVGDINEDQLNLNNNRFRNIVQLNNMTNLIVEATRVTDTTRTLLDPIAVSNSITCLNAGIHDTPRDISDHFGTYAYFKSDLHSSVPFKRQVWNYQQADFNQLNNLILTTDWSFLYNDTVDIAAKRFTSKFLELAKECIPTSLVTIRPNDKAWYNSDIRKISRHRDRQKSKALQSGKSSDWLKYRLLRNKVNNMKKHAKETFYNTLEHNIKEFGTNNPRLYWKTVKMLVKQKSSNCDNIAILQDPITNQYLSSDIEKANILNDYFTSISTIDDQMTSLPQFNLKTQASLHNFYITNENITDVLSNLSINKATGPDSISHRMLKETSQTVCNPLRIIFNRSIQEQKYPDTWKLANVMPLFKKGEKHKVSNYRPISLISCVGKVLERIVFKYLYNYLNENNLIYKYQSGFLPGHSTVYQLIDIYNQICKAIDDRQSTCLVFCDISKAFDRVWHKGLVFKLKQYGVSGNLIYWIQDYLSFRKQRVFVGSAFSDTSNLNAGVPQGSVLGPLLFLVYVNDIAESLLATTRLFADDSSLAVSSHNVTDMELRLNHDLEIISAWAKQWLVTFNQVKTEVMFFTLTNNAPPTLYFDNVKLTFVDHHKHLGITLSQNGSWHAHTSNLISSASKILGSMKALKFKLKRDTLNQIYFSYLRPILEYASVVWDNCTIFEKESLEKIQYEAARVVTGLTRSVSIDNLLRETGWTSLSDRRKIQKYILMYKEINGLLPDYIQELFPDFVERSTPYNLRNSDNFVVPPRRTELYSTSVVPSSINLWNDLDIRIRNSPTLDSFKRNVSRLFALPPVPKFYLCGDRLFSVHHARIRNNCSMLCNDLYLNHLRDSPMCNCNSGPEDAEHFFFNCMLFSAQRLELFRNTRMFHPLSTQKLLFGIPILTVEENERLFLEVQKYLKNTKRFT